MNPAFAWIVGIASSVLSGVLIQYWYVPFKISQEVGGYRERIRKLNEELDELREGVVANREVHDERFREFYKEFHNFRVKVAAKTGINGQ